MNFKSGDSSDVKNYRPICVMDVIPKVFESIIVDKLGLLLQNIICDEQHGFMPGRSTVSNLSVYCNFVSSALESNHQVDTIYTDFRKAFDTIDHSILISKLSAIGFHGNCLLWFQDYLSNRTQIVKVANSYSSPINVTSGIPQGSHLGPLLFILFINDLSDIFSNCHFLLYADDLKLFKRISTIADCNLLQSDLFKFELWCERNNMSLNAGKCYVMRSSRKRCPISFEYSLNNSALTHVSEISDLGVRFTSLLNFSNHYRNVAKDAARMLGFVMRNTADFRNLSSLKLLYFSLVRSRLEYASTIWSPQHSKYIYLLEKIQHRFLRYAAYKTGQRMARRDHNYVPLMQSFNIPTLQIRRIGSDLLFIHKIVNGLVNCPQILCSINFHIPPRQFRDARLFYTTSYKSNFGYSDPINRICEVANKFTGSFDLFTISHSALKRHLNNILNNVL